MSYINEYPWAGSNGYGWNNSSQYRQDGNSLIVVVQDSKIMKQTQEGLKQLGVTMEVYEELSSTLQQYREKLVELKVIDVPLTQEELNQQLLLELKAQTAARLKAEETLNKSMVLIDQLTGAKKELKSDTEIC